MSKCLLQDFILWIRWIVLSVLPQEHRAKRSSDRKVLTVSDEFPKTEILNIFPDITGHLTTWINSDRLQTLHGDIPSGILQYYTPLVVEFLLVQLITGVLQSTPKLIILPAQIPQFNNLNLNLARSNFGDIFARMTNVY